MSIEILGQEYDPETTEEIDLSKKMDDSNVQQVFQQLLYFPNLKKLDISMNKFTYLPYSLGQLTSLQHLNCCLTKLTSLPDSIEKLTSLRVLWCNDNELESLPESIGSLSNLCYLFCHENHLLTLPESIGSLFRLKILCCHRNDLVCLPESIGQLTHLQQLDCSQNRLTTLPKSLEKLPYLKEIICYDNHLTSISKAPTIMGVDDWMNVDDIVEEHQSHIAELDEFKKQFPNINIIATQHERFKSLGFIKAVDPLVIQDVLNKALEEKQ